MHRTKKQKESHDLMIQVADNIMKHFGEAMDMMDTLETSLSNSHTSMENIAGSTESTAEAIQGQAEISGDIREHAEHAQSLASEMIRSSDKVSQTVEEGVNSMLELGNQADNVSQCSAATEAVIDELTKKVGQVAGFVDSIISISSQTNLLALNASIESARAGEAGRGFAVVAEQIRQLAEQTKNSTEQITRIVNELNENANEVVSSVEESVEAVESQNQKIVAASETFEILNRNMTDLIDHIEEVNRQVDGLSESNNKIVENISQLSAATEEVTASAEQVHGMSEQNLQFAEQVQQAVDKMRTTADDLKKYL